MALDDLPEINGLTSRIIAAAVEVHRTLGAGLLESLYLKCFAFEIRSQSLRIETERSLSVIYKDARMNCGFRLDAIVEDTVIVEIKSIADFAPIHRAQMMTYLKLTGCPAGLLINFNVPILRSGVKRVLNTRPRSALRASATPR